MREANDQILIDEKATGAASQDSSWGAAIESNYDHLLKFGLWLTGGNRDDAQDIVHQAICKVLSSSGRPMITRAALSYLFMAVSHAHIDNYRAHRHRWISYDDEVNEALLNQLVDEQTGEAMQTRLEDEELRQRMLLGFGPLNKRERELLSMYLEGMNTKEIAATLGEDRRLVGSDWNALRMKVRYRLGRQTKR